jgi:hypothetical protein
VSSLKFRERYLLTAIRLLVVLINFAPEGFYLLKVKVTLEQTIKAQRGSRGIALLFL